MTSTDLSRNTDQVRRMVRRPKYPKTDSNHKVVSKVVSELGRDDIHLIDTSAYGGHLTDYLLCINGKVIFLEVKQEGERDNLTEGEKETQWWGVPFYVVVTKEYVLRIIHEETTG